GGSTGQYLAIRDNGTLQMYSASFQPLTSPPLEWEAGARYSIRVRRTRDGRVSIWRDGSMLVEGTRPPFYWGSSITLGTEYNGSGPLNGYISSLRIRSIP